MQSRKQSIPAHSVVNFYMTLQSWFSRSVQEREESTLNHHNNCNSIRVHTGNMSNNWCMYTQPTALHRVVHLVTACD